MIQYVVRPKNHSRSKSLSSFCTRKFS